MPIALPEALDAPIAPVFAALPFASALKRLVAAGPAPFPEASARVGEALADPALAGHPGVGAGLWLYADELDKAHGLCQDLDTPTGAFWHAVVHRRGGDFSNARYWMTRALGHPAMAEIDLAGGGAGAGTAVGAYDAVALIDRVERAHAAGEGGDAHPELVAAQHHEWRALFTWCLANDM